jgi:hypothetical protein
LCNYFDKQAGLPAHILKILANVLIALTVPSNANATTIALVIAFPASESLPQHRSFLLNSNAKFCPQKVECSLFLYQQKVEAHC